MIYPKRSFLRLLLFALIACCSHYALHSYNNPHFYQSFHIPDEPRFQKPWLTSIDVDLSGGRTSTGFNAHGLAVPVLDIYGFHNMHQLGSGVALRDPHNALDTIITDLSLVPAHEPFGLLSYQGKFSTLELNLTYTQNITHGFFLEANIPIRALCIDHIHVIDLTPDSGLYNKHTPEWQRFFESFDAILERYGLSQKPLRETHTGDTSLLFGWAINYQNTHVLDFIDMTIKTGILFPTGKKSDKNTLWALSWGYDKHWGVPLSCDIACGCYDWLSAGAHFDILPFAQKTEIIRMKTAPAQSGLIKLAEGQAIIHHGSIVVASVYLKADHLARTLSFLTGYSYARKNKDTVIPINTHTFDLSIVNSDETFHAWTTHTLHIALEYDFTKENNVLGPRLGFSINIPVAGKRIFKTVMSDITFGLEISADI